MITACGRAHKPAAARPGEDGRRTDDRRTPGAARAAARRSRPDRRAYPAAPRAPASRHSTTEEVLVRTAPRRRGRPSVLPAVTARDLLPRDERFEHELTGGDGRRIVVL